MLDRIVLLPILTGLALLPLLLLAIVLTALLCIGMLFVPLDFRLLPWAKRMCICQTYQYFSLKNLWLPMTATGCWSSAQ